MPKSNVVVVEQPRKLPMQLMLVPTIQKASAEWNAIQGLIQSVIKGSMCPIPNITSEMYKTSMISACEVGNERALHFILGVSGINANFDSNILLRTAARWGHFGIVRMLCSMNGNGPLGDGDESLNQAAMNGHLDIVKYILTNHGGDVKAAILNSCEKGYKGAVMFLATLQTVKMEDDFFGVALMKALPHFQIVDFLVQRRVNETLTEKDKEHIRMAFLSACDNGYVDTVRILGILPIWKIEGDLFRDALLRGLGHLNVVMWVMSRRLSDTMSEKDIEHVADAFRKACAAGYDRVCVYFGNLHNLNVSGEQFGNLLMLAVPYPPLVKWLVKKEKQLNEQEIGFVWNTLRKAIGDGLVETVLILSNIPCLNINETGREMLKYTTKAVAEKNIVIKHVLKM